MLPWDKVLNFPWERPGREHRVSQSHLPPPSTAPRSPQNPPLVLVWGWVHALGLCYGVEAMQCSGPGRRKLSIPRNVSTDGGMRKEMQKM